MMSVMAYVYYCNVYMCSMLIVIVLKFYLHAGGETVTTQSSNNRGKTKTVTLGFR